MKPLALATTSIALALIVCTSAADSPPTGVLSVHITQLHSNDGQVGCALYKSAAGFPTDASAASQARWCAIKDKSSTCSFDPIPAGTYAVACFHDENGNKKLDKGMF